MARQRTYTVILRGDHGEKDIILHVLATDFKLRSTNVVNSYEFYNGPACVAAFCACDVKRITSEATTLCGMKMNGPFIDYLT